MTIKFIPSSNKVEIEGQKEHEAMLINLMKCLINKMNRVELQLEKLTEESIDADDGDIL